METGADPLRIVRAELSGLATSLAQCPAPVRSEVAFAGRSNVGKSSLLNALTGQRKLARTSNTPGCTRQLAFFDVETADGASLTFVDLPGYGFARRSKQERSLWSDFAEAYLLGRPTLRAVVVLFDARRGPEREEHDLLELLADARPQGRVAPDPILVATKLDTIAAAKRKLRTAEIGKLIQRPVIATSVEQPETIRRLWHKLRASAGLGA